MKQLQMTIGDQTLDSFDKSLIILIKSKPNLLSFFDLLNIIFLTQSRDSLTVIVGFILHRLSNNNKNWRKILKVIK